jgi:cytochrome c biogenesis protein CcmG, thiol:disulfide interchange protein DsbE
MNKKSILAIITVLIFVGFIFFLAKGLMRDQNQMPSALLDKSLPDFQLPDLYDEQAIYNKSVLLGEIALVNVWASWCPPCAKEHEVIVELANSGIPVYGLNYQDDRNAAKVWLIERGDPYKKIFYDKDGKVGIDWGVIAVPETFLLDASGKVQYRHIGEMTREVWYDNFIPVINHINLQNEARFLAISEELRCLVCQNQTLLDSDAPLAKSLKQQIRQSIERGDSDEVIMQYLTDRYGEFILYQPPVQVNTWLLWFGPVIILFVIIAIFIVILRHARQNKKDDK